jgi:hypothetical protein
MDAFMYRVSGCLLSPPRGLGLAPAAQVVDEVRLGQGHDSRRRGVHVGSAAHGAAATRRGFGRGAGGLFFGGFAEASSAGRGARGRRHVSGGRHVQGEGCGEVLWRRARCCARRGAEQKTTLPCPSSTCAKRTRKWSQNKNEKKKTLALTPISAAQVLQHPTSFIRHPSRGGEGRGTCCSSESSTAC